MCANRSTSALNMYELGSPRVMNTMPPQYPSSSERQKNQEKFNKLCNKSSKELSFHGSSSAVNYNDPLKDYHVAQQAAAGGKFNIK